MRTKTRTLITFKENENDVKKPKVASSEGPVTGNKKIEIPFDTISANGSGSVDRRAHSTDSKIDRQPIHRPVRLTDNCFTIN